jgi:4-hydroxythreonine-4-phosphate dehydrogenase
MKKSIGIAISMGDPAGVGPEVLAKALNSLDRTTNAVFFVVGDTSLLLRYGLKKKDAIKLVDLKNLDLVRLRPGKPTRQTARASLEYLTTAMAMIKRGTAQGLVTAPISKESIRCAGFRWPGHTEYLAEYFKARQVEMVFVADALKVALVTRHMSLKGAVASVKKKRIVEAGSFLLGFVKKNFKIRNPKIAVCGLNPHAGEGGLFGKEEKTQIFPAVRELNRRCGRHFFGPLAADAVFHKACQGNYDLVLAMYHDQGLIPFKTVAFDNGVHLTAGLPFIRTSPVHGTAFDIAGRNIANYHSMAHAIKLSYQLLKNSL